MVILEKGNFRLSTITKLDVGESESAFVELPISEGLAIEKKTFSNESFYYVICFIKYNNHEESSGIENDTCGRLLDIELSEWTLFKEMYKTAKQLVETANMEVDDND